MHNSNFVERKLEKYKHALIPWSYKQANLKTPVRAILSQSVFGFPFYVKAQKTTIFDCLLKAIQNTTISCKFGR